VNLLINEKFLGIKFSFTDKLFDDRISFGIKYLLKLCRYIQCNENKINNNY